MAGPMPVKSAGGKEYKYIVVDEHSRAVGTQPDTDESARWPYAV
jgi:hypothetical protein